jgi:hypothetical protein
MFNSGADVFALNTTGAACILNGVRGEAAVLRLLALLSRMPDGAIASSVQRCAFATRALLAAILQQAG